MTVTGLRFEVTWSFPYPVTTTGNGTGLAMCKRNGDPYLAFLTQTSFADDVVYLFDIDGTEDHRHSTPVGFDTVSGLDYDPLRRWIWACQGTSGEDVVLAFDPDDGSLQQSLTLPTTPTMTMPHALACNGLYLLRGGGDTIEAWSLTGALLGTRRYAGRGVTGLSTAPLSFCFLDTYADEIVVIGPLGHEIAVSSGIGAAGGMEAIAFDMVRYREMEDIPQLWEENGTLGDVGTLYHPDTPWTPDPWAGRHRIYVANQIDQTIYAGYLTAE